MLLHVLHLACHLLLLTFQSFIFHLVPGNSILSLALSLQYSLALVDTLKPQGLFGDVTDETSLIYDGQSFLSHILRSLAKVKRSVVIVCPRVKPGRNSQITARLFDLVTQCIKIAVVTREPNEHTERLQMHGVQIFLKENLTLNCAIFDRSVVWYGNVQLLGYHSPNDNIITLHNPELATTIFNMLHS